MTKGERVKDLRKSMNMSRVKFSEHFGIPTRTIEDWEMEKREPNDYTVDMLVKVAAYEKLAPMAWVFSQYSDEGGIGSEKIFRDKDEAVRYAEKEWNNMTEHDQRRRDWFYVGLFAMVWDDYQEEFVPDGDVIAIAWNPIR